jgi:hypothetical protein
MALIADGWDGEMNGDMGLSSIDDMFGDFGLGSFDFPQIDFGGFDFDLGAAFSSDWAVSLSEMLNFAGVLGDVIGSVGGVFVEVGGAILNGIGGIAGGIVDVGGAILGGVGSAVGDVAAAILN